MKILNKEIEFDFLDVDNMEKYETALEKYMNRLEEIKQFDGKNSEGYRKICDIVYMFFDELIDKGCAIQILGEKRNYGKCLKAMNEIINEKLRSDKEVEDMLEKYSLDRIK